MKRIAHWIFVVAFVAQIATRARAADPLPSPITIDAQIMSDDVKDEAGKPKTLRTLVVTLINTGKEPVTVITQHLDRSSSDSDITLGLNGTATLDGHLLIPSLSTLAPVTLRPGEATVLSTDSVDLSDYKGGKLTIDYEVTKPWGERLAIWAGKVSAEAKAAKSE
jgi:hypothetical protein